MSLSALLSAPHPSIKTASDSSLNSVPIGQGPADLFSIRFDEMFEPTAHGVICGREVTRAELKESFLSLKSRWDVQNATAIAAVAHPGYFASFHPTMAAKLEFTPLSRDASTHQTTIMAEASGEDLHGSERIAFLKLEGEESLFRPEAL
ncbi:hypothetical protein BC629DRAFT_1589092 [Irpex lacteus]|nr:hypothetical protein BC629DRAFT_1589092 [Irpex lacteus]